MLQRAMLDLFNALWSHPTLIVPAKPILTPQFFLTLSFIRPCSLLFGDFHNHKNTSYQFNFSQISIFSIDYISFLASRHYNSSLASLRPSRVSNMSQSIALGNSCQIKLALIFKIIQHNNVTVADQF
jgi:hypothetical protein